MRKLAGELGFGIAFNIAVIVGTSVVLALLPALIAGAAGLLSVTFPFLIISAIIYGFVSLRHKKQIRRNKNAGLNPAGEACLKPESMRLPPPSVDASFFDQ